MLTSIIELASRTSATGELAKMFCFGTCAGGGIRAVANGSRETCWVGEPGAELILIVDANEMSRSEDRYASASSQLTARLGELGSEEAGGGGA